MIDQADAGRVLSEVGRICRTLSRARRRSQERSIAGTQYAFLQHLCGTEARLSDLARALDVSLPVASRGVDALESDGLVSRRPDPSDARAHLIAITAAGQEWLQDQQQQFVARLAEALHDWGPEDAQQAVEVLARIHRHIDEIIDPSHA